MSLTPSAAAPAIPYSPQPRMDFPGSTKPSTDADFKRLAEDIFDQLFEDRGLCPVCFARKRSFYPEFDLQLANRLYMGPKSGKGGNKQTFSAMGHRLKEDGSLQVNSATSDADPSTYQDVVPETFIKEFDSYGRVTSREWRPPRPKTICSICGVIDYDFDDARSKKELYEAIENISEHIQGTSPGHSEGTDDLDVHPFALDAAKEVVRQANKKDSLAGRDRDVLISAIHLGLRVGYRRAEHEDEG